MNTRKILLANPRGFCAGVDMSIKALVWLARTLPGRRIYCFHEIVHNELVVNWFEQRGVVFVNELSEIPADHDPDVALMLSAHGTTPELEREARSRFSIVVNSVCPLVSKVHNELRHAEGSGSEIVYLGNPHHDEGIGTLGFASKQIHVIRPSCWQQDLASMSDFSGTAVTFIAQTTLSQDLFEEVHVSLVAKIGFVQISQKSDLCFATTHRQDVVKAMASECDHMIVVGSVQSANTKSLHDVAATRCPSTFRINSVAELPSALDGIVGVTAGASAPEYLVQSVCETLDPIDGIHEFDFIQENEYFKLPPDLRRLLEAGAIQPLYDIEEDREQTVEGLMREL